MAILNLYAAWIGILLGAIMGAVQGMFFHKESWLGGYGTWARRMTRLGHISFFGIAFINLAFYLTVKSMDFASEMTIPIRVRSSYKRLFIFRPSTTSTRIHQQLSVYERAWPCKRS